MLTFLFWNFKGKRDDILASLTRGHKVDVLMLAECPLKPASVLEALNRPTADYYYVANDCPKVDIYTRFSDEYLSPFEAGADFTVRRLCLPGRLDVLLCVVHFPSKLRQEPIDQTVYAMKFSEMLAGAEGKAGHARTVLVGDLNMNPYEDGVVTTTGLHAVMTRTLARRERRKFKFASNLFFYNPMWSHFGEQREGHAGTYYYPTPKARADFWNIYDQVMVRPDLLPFFKDEDVHILHRGLGADVSFLTERGIPDKEAVSDHLPLLFRLHI